MSRHLPVGKGSRPPVYHYRQTEAARLRHYLYFAQNGEIFKICDEITILRDGKWIDTVAVKETTMDELVAKMVGRSLTQRFQEKNNTPGKSCCR